MALVRYLLFSFFVSAGVYAENVRKDLGHAWFFGLLWPFSGGITLGRLIVREETRQ